MQSGIAKYSGENTKQVLIFPGEARDLAVPTAPRIQLLAASLGALRASVNSTSEF